jgi:hypothetical protein
MKKEIVLVLLAVLLTSSVLSQGIGGSIGIVVDTDDFEPFIWMDPNARLMLDDYNNPGAITGGEEPLIERIENYAFEGEQLLWNVLVYDQNGIQDISQVYVGLLEEDTDDEVAEAACLESGNCEGSPDVDSCDVYDYDQCSAVTGCSLICDTVVIDGESIQVAIDAATPGDIVCVDTGIYDENVLVNKALTLVGLHNPESADAAQITVSSGTYHIAVSSNDVTIRGFRIDGGGFVASGQYAGIIVNTDINNSNLDNIIIENNVITELSTSPGSVKGIHLHNENNGLLLEISNTIVRNNRISEILGVSSGAYGIQMVNDMNGVLIEDNIVTEVSSPGWAFGIAVDCHGGIPTVTDININNNQVEILSSLSSAAVLVESCAYASTITLRENNLVSGLANLGAETLDAENNWFGSENLTDFNDTIFGLIDFDPWAIVPFVNGPVVDPLVCQGTPNSCPIIASSQTCIDTLGCDWQGGPTDIDVWFDGQHFTELDNTNMAWYTCKLTIETPATMHGEYFASAYVFDSLGYNSNFSENELWFLNPIIALGIDGTIDFGSMSPGETKKSGVVTLTNNAEVGSGVLLDMFIAGTDFYSPSGAAACPDSNVLRLTNMKYYAVGGAYNTCSNAGTDGECYDNIPYYVDGAGSPNNNNMQRIINETSEAFGVYPAGNMLSPGADLSLIFKLSLPSPCIGGPFTDGQIRFFGEAI